MTVISFIFKTFLVADIRMKFNDLLTKASIWDRYVVYLVIGLAFSYVILMPFIFPLNFTSVLQVPVENLLPTFHVPLS